jgi:hypothetical protein
MKEVADSAEWLSLTGVTTRIRVSTIMITITITFAFLTARRRRLIPIFEVGAIVSVRVRLANALIHDSAGIG